MNRFGKFLFVCTSLAPVLGAFAIIDFVDGKPWYYLVAWIGGAIGLTCICDLLMLFVYRNRPKETLEIAKVSLTDKEVLAYLISYLLPILAKGTLDVRSNPWTTLFVYAIIVLVIYHSNSFHFSPLLSMAGFHFYEVETKGKMKYLLISRKTIRKQEFSAQVVEISDYMYLDVDE